MPDPSGPSGASGSTGPPAEHPESLVPGPRAVREGWNLTARAVRCARDGVAPATVLAAPDQATTSLRFEPNQDAMTGLRFVCAMVRAGHEHDPRVDAAMRIASLDLSRDATP